MSVEKRDATVARLDRLKEEMKWGTVGGLALTAARSLECAMARDELPESSFAGAVVGEAEPSEVSDSTSGSTPPSSSLEQGVTDCGAPPAVHTDSPDTDDVRALPVEFAPCPADVGGH